MIILTYLIAGAFAGFVAGLLGVGGGIIVVPVLVFCFEAQGFEPSVLTHMAIASSLACIVFTSISSTFKHHRLGSVDWILVRKIVLGIALGSLLGVTIAVQIEGEILRRILGVFALFVALKMATGSAQMNEVVSSLIPKRLLFPAGAVIGSVSSLFGIGGGTLSIPFFYRLGLPMVRVVGTAAACGLPIAFAGALANVFFGYGRDDLPGYSWGYIYLPAVLFLSLASVVFARVGAKNANRMQGDKLRKVFAFCLFIVGIKFLFF